MSNKMPIYAKIANEIEEKIKTGEYKTGDIMMSESDMSESYDVSRVTVRRAYGVLIKKGILRTVQGKGTFVNDFDARDWTWMRSFTTEVTNSGHYPTTEIIDFNVIEADVHISNQLAIPIGTECFYLKRKRFIDSNPVWLTRTYFPKTLCLNLTKEYFSVAGITQSVFKVLSLNFGIKFCFRKEISEAVIIGEEDGKAIGLDAIKPVISSAMIAYDKNRTPILYENTIFKQSIARVARVANEEE